MTLAKLEALARKFKAAARAFLFSDTEPGSPAAAEAEAAMRAAHAEYHEARALFLRQTPRALPRVWDMERAIKN